MSAALVRRVLVLIAATATAGAAPSSAAAAGIDVSSDHTALVSYHGFLSELVNGLGTGRAQDRSFVTGVGQACPGVLKSLGSRPKSQVSQTALTDFGVELGGDLTLRFLVEAHKPFGHLSAQLERLHWSNRATAQTVQAMVGDEHVVLGLNPSRLCADARAIAGDPATTPPATQRFASTYLSDSETLNRQLGRFLGVLERFQTSQEHALILSINRLVKEFGSASSSTEKTDAGRVQSELGLTSSG